MKLNKLIKKRMNIYHKMYLIDIYDTVQYNTFQDWEIESTDKFEHESLHDCLSILWKKNLIEKFTIDMNYKTHWKLHNKITDEFITKLKKQIILYRLAHED